jgi:hypothetical protein
MACKCTYTVIIVCLYEPQKILDNVHFDDLGPTSDEYIYHEHMTTTFIVVPETAIQVTLWCNKACLLLL